MHRKVKLQDEEVSEEYQRQFKVLSPQYKDVFTTDSTNISRTDQLLWILLQ